MSRHLAPMNGKRAVRNVDRPAAEVEVVEPTSKAGPFVSFHYSYTELSSVGGKTHLKSRKTRLEDGKLVSESLDGELDRGVYDQAVNQARQHFFDQTSLFLQAISSLLPFSRK
jgi:hypothetical protein